MDKLPLDRVRVADFSWQIAGPTCTRYLGAMGAEVIRIESNRRPDPYRERSISHFINQSKKSVTLNLAHPKGVQLAKQVVGLSDVVIENFAPGVIERLGLGYEELRRASPQIVMLSSAGLGHSGPDMDQVAYGTLIQCFTGWSALTMMFLPVVVLVLTSSGELSKSRSSPHNRQTPLLVEPCDVSMIQWSGHCVVVMGCLPGTTVISTS